MFAHGGSSVMTHVLNRAGSLAIVDFTLATIGCGLLALSSTSGVICDGLMTLIRSVCTLWVPLVLWMAIHLGG